MGGYFYLYQCIVISIGHYSPGLIFLDEIVCYRPQRSCEGYVFTRVCHSVRGGVCLSAWWDTPQEQTPPRDGHCCGRYASYWNAFLFQMKWNKTVSKILVFICGKETSNVAQLIKSFDSLIRRFSFNGKTSSKAYTFTQPRCILKIDHQKIYITVGKLFNCCV